MVFTLTAALIVALLALGAVALFGTVGFSLAPVVAGASLHADEDDALTYELSVTRRLMFADDSDLVKLTAAGVPLSAVRSLANAPKAPDHDAWHVATLDDETYGHAIADIAWAWEVATHAPASAPATDRERVEIAFGVFHERTLAAMGL